MKRLHIYLIIYIAALGFASCRHHHDDAEPRQAVRTVIIYMMAENSMSRYLQTDIDEMVSAKAKVPDSVNFIIYKDDVSQPCIMQLTARDGLHTLYTYPEDHLSTDSTEMLQNLRRIISEFPAKHYSLDFWSHASGWIPRRKTLGIDNGQNTTSNIGFAMNITELRWTLEQLPHIESIFFDACAMQNIETAYELRHVTDWIVSSPAEIPGPGAPYSTILPYLCAGDPVGLARAYHAYYPNNHDWPYGGVLISAIRTDGLDQLARATRRVVPSLFGNRTEVSTDGFQWYISEYASFTYCYDMMTTFYRLLPEDEFAQWRTAFDEAVPCRLTTTRWHANWCSDTAVRDTAHCGAISMFVPNSKDDKAGWAQALHQMQWYKAAGWDETGW